MSGPTHGIRRARDVSFILWVLATHLSTASVAFIFKAKQHDCPPRSRDCDLQCALPLVGTQEQAACLLWMKQSQGASLSAHLQSGEMH